MHPLLVSWDLELRRAPYNPGSTRMVTLPGLFALPRPQLPVGMGRMVPTSAVKTVSE